MMEISRKFAICWFLISFLTSQINAQEVPNQVNLGDLTLKLDRFAQREVQNRVNLLVENQSTFQKKIKTADLYLPLIAEIFKKNQIPEDFKYLALLDNTLSDSLRFWQMNPEIASSYGLKINSLLDESENVITCTRKIAELFKKNNSQLKNWIFTLLTYHLKLEGVKDYLQKVLDPLNLGNLVQLKTIPISGNFHPDILQFLAYKVAFQDVLGKNLRPTIELITFNQTQGRSLQGIAQEFTLPYEQIKQFNQWLKTDVIPNDRRYDLIIPIPAQSPTSEVNISIGSNGIIICRTSPTDILNLEETENARHVVSKGQTLYGIARLYNISPQELMKWNNLSNQSVLKIGQTLLVNSSAKIQPSQINSLAEQTVYHTVAKSEGLYVISRKYKASVGEIKNWNNLPNDLIHPGQKLKILVKKNENKEVIKPTPAPNTPTKTVEIPKNENTIPTKPKNTQKRTLSAKSVPASLQMGGLNLKINRKAQEMLKKDVDALLKNPQYFFTILNRVNIYSPLVEEILQLEGIPLDFRYLPIQESELRANAVSTSNAVGYWQFKEGSAREVGINVNREVDERMHIMSATLGASKYLKRNHLYFQNWVFTLLSYNMGFTGAKNYVALNYPNQDFENLDEIEINEKTHWYIRKFLAHKIAFETEIGLDNPPQILNKYVNGKAKTLKQIAQETKVNQAEIQPYNMWLKKLKVPEDKVYTVLVPTKN